MAATFQYQEDNGAATGSPAQGATRTTITRGDWKSVDDTTTPYASATVQAGYNSFSKYIFGRFTGTFNQISDGRWAHTAGVFPAGVSLRGLVSSTYQTPSQTTNVALTANMTPVIDIASGQAVLFSPTGPQAATPTATLSAAGYSQYLITQLQTLSTAPAGDIGEITLTLRYNEN